MRSSGRHGGNGRRAALAALALAAALGGCSTRDVETTPFRIRAEGPDGTSLVAALPGAGFIVVTGPATLPSPTTLVVAPAAVEDQNGPRSLDAVTFAFDAAAAPDVAFPPRLAGLTVTVELNADPAGAGPLREPLTIPALRIASGETSRSYEFLIGESAYTLADGMPGVPALLGPFVGTEDVPFFEVLPNWTEYEPAECGMVYDADMLRVTQSIPVVTLAAGRQAQVYVGLRAEPWNVLHVQSWHRRGTCAGQAGSWTQFVAWR